MFPSIIKFEIIKIIKFEIEKMMHLLKINDMRDFTLFNHPKGQARQSNLRRRRGRPKAWSEWWGGGGRRRRTRRPPAKGGAWAWAAEEEVRQLRG